jgi:sensor histidine kinase YesM
MDETSGLIVIESYCENDELHIKVRDDGPGLQAGWLLENSEGIGLANTSERLRHLYGTEHRFDLRNSATGGMIAAITIPFRAGYELGQGR